MDALKKIQQELKAPKGQYNSFGKYNYRSAEDILEAVKPLLGKYDAELTLSDDIIEVGGRIYVKASAEIRDGSTVVTVTAFAREPEEKKGMDASQVTGTASSYARKYALNGLFLIDDTKDADSNEYRQQTEQSYTASGKVSSPQVKMIEELIKDTKSDLGKLLVFYRVTHLEDMTKEQGQDCIEKLKSKKK